MSNNGEQRKPLHGEEIRNAYDRFTYAHLRMEELSNQICQEIVDSLAEMPLEELSLSYNLRNLFMYGGMLHSPHHPKLVARDEMRIRQALSNRLSELFVNADGSNLLKLSNHDLHVETVNRGMPQILVTAPTEKDLGELSEELMNFLRKVSKMNILLHNKPLVVTVFTHDNLYFRSAKTILL